MAHTFIRQIKAFQLNFRIRVRVLRIWRPRRYNSEIYDGLHYILVDEEAIAYGSVKFADFGLAKITTKVNEIQVLQGTAF
ncbi:hypothetical protein ABKV19_008570 [Rosa sericea]